MEKKWEEDMIEGVLYEGEVEREVGRPSNTGRRT